VDNVGFAAYNKADIEEVVQKLFTVEGSFAEFLGIAPSTWFRKGSFSAF
jgi:hypothetical protein